MAVQRILSSFAILPYDVDGMCVGIWIQTSQVLPKYPVLLDSLTRNLGGYLLWYKPEDPQCSCQRGTRCTCM